MFYFKLRWKKKKSKTIKEMMNSTTFEFKIYAYQENIKSSDKSKNKEAIWNKNNSHRINIQFI